MKLIDIVNKKNYRCTDCIEVIIGNHEVVYVCAWDNSMLVHEECSDNDRLVCKFRFNGKRVIDKEVQANISNLINQYQAGKN